MIMKHIRLPSSDLEPVMRASKRTLREGKVRKISCASRSQTFTSPHRVDVLASSRHLIKGIRGLESTKFYFLPLFIVTHGPESDKRA